jgi:hypothetical protein
MTKEDFDLAKGFMFTDIEREIQLAQRKQGIKGVHSGGGNFLAALGLLCYTEFAGGLLEDGGSCEKFCCFLYRMGKEYENFDKQHDVYKNFRCGLAHEYFVKKKTTIYMPALKEFVCGVGLESDGSYYFAVGKYFEDFQKALILLQKELYP